MIEILSIVAAIFELLGLYLLGKANRFGFLVNLIGNASWIIYSIVTKSAIGLIIVCSVALILNSKGFINWSKKK